MSCRHSSDPTAPGEPDDIVTRAAELAELIVDAVAHSDQDWPQIATWARQLAALAESA